jgi:hypothetical protein
MSQHETVCCVLCGGFSHMNDARRMVTDPPVGEAMGEESLDTGFRYAGTGNPATLRGSNERERNP